jgi:hypothetical protein
VKRRAQLESLEDRRMLTAVPIAEDDPWYSAEVNTPLTIGGSDRTLLENDWDPQVRERSSFRDGRMVRHWSRRQDLPFFSATTLVAHILAA